MSGYNYIYTKKSGTAEAQTAFVSYANRISCIGDFFIVEYKNAYKFERIKDNEELRKIQRRLLPTTNGENGMDI